MKEFRFTFAGEDAERVLKDWPAETKATSASPKVEIVSNGLASLVFINGQRINGVLDVQLPMRPEEIRPQVVLKVYASVVVHRTVNSDEFMRLRS